MSQSFQRTAQLTVTLSVVLMVFSACSETVAKDVHQLPKTPPKIPQPEVVAGSNATARAPARTPRYNATTAAHRTSMLSPIVPGLIKKILVKEGDLVSKGDVIAILDTRGTQLRIRQAQAGLRTARAQARAVRTAATRARRLYSDKAIPAAQRDRATDQVEITASVVAQAEVGVAMARQALADAKLRAPYDGVVARRLASEGEYASPMSPKMIVSLQERSPIDLRISIPAGVARSIKVGLPITVYFDDGREAIRAKIDRISPALNPRTRNLTAIVELPNDNGALLPGLFASVAIPRLPASKARTKDTQKP